MFSHHALENVHSVLMTYDVSCVKADWHHREPEGLVQE